MASRPEVRRSPWLKCSPASADRSLQVQKLEELTYPCSNVIKAGNEMAQLLEADMVKLGSTLHLLQGTTDFSPSRASLAAMSKQTVKADTCR